MKIQRGGGDMFSMYMGMKCKEQGIGFIQCWCMYMGLCILIIGLIFLIIFLIIIISDSAGIGKSTTKTIRKVGDKTTTTTTKRTGNKRTTTTTTT
jgi:Na+-transporting methylmalonyl-CoA/oxaloacetate decarboxylase gamma subunit